MQIYDTMQIVKPEISTRFILKHSRVLIHQPIGYAKGQSSDMEITVREILKLKELKLKELKLKELKLKELKEELNKIISEHTNKPFEKVQKDSDRDYWMTSEDRRSFIFKC